jgi:hypothetical protein
MIYPLLSNHNNQENLPPVLNNHHHLPSVAHNEKDLNINTANQMSKMHHPTSATPAMMVPRHNFVNKRAFGRDLSNLPSNNGQVSGSTTLASVLENINQKQPQLVVQLQNKVSFQLLIVKIAVKFENQAVLGECWSSYFEYITSAYSSELGWK